MRSIEDHGCEDSSAWPGPARQLPLRPRSRVRGARRDATGGFVAEGFDDARPRPPRSRHADRQAQHPRPVGRATPSSHASKREVPNPQLLDAPVLANMVSRSDYRRRPPPSSSTRRASGNRACSHRQQPDPSTLAHGCGATSTSLSRSSVGPMPVTPAGALRSEPAWAGATTRARAVPTGRIGSDSGPDRVSGEARPSPQHRGEYRRRGRQPDGDCRVKSSRSPAPW